jgi:dihydrofolate reductase
MGRKTYEVAAQSGTPAYPKVKNYVCSRTLKQTPDPAVELVSGDGAAFVAALKRKKGRGICIMGGGELAAALFEADVIDEVGLNVHPVLLGSGIPLFLPLRHQIDLALTEHQPLGNGCALLRYRVKHGRPAAA